MIGEDLLRCTTSHGEFAIRSGDIRHVARAEQLRADVNDDGRIASLKLGSQHVPVFSLACALGLADAAGAAQPDQHVAVTGEGAELAGWLVDKLTREPAAEVKLAPMPSSVGGRASRWFEAVVSCGNGDVVLLIDPAALSPFANRAGLNRRAASSTPVSINPSTSADPVALVFSTEVFPESPIAKFALSGRQVAAIVQPTETIRVPGAAPHISGLTLWRDVAVPIVDYRSHSREPSPNWRRMIARCGGRSQSLLAFAINDEVIMHRPSVDDKAIDAAPCPFASGVFSLNGAPVALLDLDALAKSGAGRDN